jgi:vacuolar-type H+-ATPase subunit I/STV1
VNRIVEERVKKLKGEVESLRAVAGEVEGIKAKLQEADDEREKAREEAELKGKSELEKLQHQLAKATEARKALESDFSKRFADEQNKTKQATDGLTDYVRRHHVQSALAEAGIAPKATKAAVLAFLNEAQIEMGEGHELKTIAVGGKTFDKPTEAAKHFLSENPYFAAPPPGGSGTPRPNGGGAAPQPNSLGGLLSAGLTAQKPV